MTHRVGLGGINTLSRDSNQNVNILGYFSERARLAHPWPLIRPILMQSDRWIEKGDFRAKIKSCVLTRSKKCHFDPNFFDRAVRYAHAVEKIDFFNGMPGSDCSIEKVFEAHRISHHPRKQTITPYNSSDAGLTATAAAAAAAAAHSESAWYILFSARQQRVRASYG